MSRTHALRRRKLSMVEKLIVNPRITENQRKVGEGDSGISINGVETETNLMMRLYRKYGEGEYVLQVQEWRFQVVWDGYIQEVNQKIKFQGLKKNDLEMLGIKEISTTGSNGTIGRKSLKTTKVRKHG